MRVLVLFLFLMMLFTASWAQDAVPPDGAHVVASPEGVLLQWDVMDPSQSYLIQVYSEQTVVAEQGVVGGKVTLPLQAGMAYRWQVSLKGPEGFTKVVASREFQVVGEARVMEGGADGEAGGPEPDNSYRFNGKPGQNGAELTVTLTQVGGYVSVFVTGGVAANQQYYLSPGTAPLLIAVPGGRGGNGGSGAPAAAGYYEGAYEGSAGGNGANGGMGGTITVVSNGLTVSDYLEFDTQGGSGGVGGPGGGPGLAPGSNGSNGANGRIVVR